MLLTWSQKQGERRGWGVLVCICTQYVCMCMCVLYLCRDDTGNGIKFSLIARCATRLIKVLGSLFTPKSRQVNCWKLCNY